MYRHVDILNSSGLEAAILHRSASSRCTWFDNNTRVMGIDDIKFMSSDFLVIPEVYGSLYADPEKRPKASKLFNKMFFGTPAKKIIFNQNTYNTFHGHDFSLKNLKSIYLDKEVYAVIVVSDDNRDYLHMAFPELRIVRVHNSINHELFIYQPDKRPLISFMPRKNVEHVVQVLNHLKFSGKLEGFAIAPIDGHTERETATIMKKSLIFLSFGYPEGFSLPPAEAMSCGCVVIGYHGMGGREYFLKEHCFPVEMGDIIGYANKVAEIIGIYKNNPENLQTIGKKASDFIRENYTIEREQKDVLDMWYSFMWGG